METLEIGKRKVFTDVTLEVVLSPDNGCTGCWFYRQTHTCFNHPRRRIMGNCAWLSRVDGKDVIFKAVIETT